MKIIICLNNDLISNIALNLLRYTLLEHEVQIFLSNGVGSPEKGVEEIKLLEQSLPCDFLFPLLDKNGRPEDNCYITFEQFHKYHGMKLFYPENINSSDNIKHIEEYAPDLIISIRYGQIFRDAIISIPKYGIVNLHSGILPDYKGILATFWAMLNGETRVGCTLHYIVDTTIDTGPIIDRSYLSIDKKKSLFWHVSELYKEGAGMIKDVLSKINSGEPIAVMKQNLSEGKYFSLPTDEDVSRFREQGFKIVDNGSYMALLQKYNNTPAYRRE